MIAYMICIAQMKMKDIFAFIYKNFPNDEKVKLDDLWEKVFDLNILYNA